MSAFQFPTPAQAAAERAKALEPDVSRLRTIVWAALVKPSSSREVWVDLSRTRVPAEAITVVRRELETAGWRSRYESSQRDGDALVVWPAQEAV